MFYSDRYNLAYRATMRYSTLWGILCISMSLLFLPLLAQAATTEVHVVQYASDGVTMLNETVVDYTWMEANLPVQGDGVTHYYHQGPIFEDAWTEVHPNETWNLEEDKWNPEEDGNVLGKDLGAVKGTNVKDLCELVGGMSEGDTVEIKASDGFSKKFPYSNVYEPDARQGPMVVTWYTTDAAEDGNEGGYVPDDYYSGMRLVFLADTSTNPWGEHVFGISDMKACLPEECWHYFQYPDYPTTTGYTIKYINRIFIYSTVEPLEVRVIEVLPVDVTLNISDLQQFNATAYDQNGDEMPSIVFAWTSSNESVGTIDNTGLFTALAEGTSTITAVNKTVNGTVTVTVSIPTPTPTASPTPTPTPSPTAPPQGGGGGGGTIVPPYVVSTPTPTATSQVSPTPSSMHSPHPSTTTPTTTPTTTAPSPAATPTPTKTPTPTPSVPGFDALFAVICLLAVAYLVHKEERG
jgi:hypothetical protein